MTRRARPAGEKRIGLIGLLVIVGLLSGFALLIQHNVDDARHALVARFESRAELTSLFADDYVADIAKREQSQAEHVLAGTTVTQRDFEQLVTSFGFPAAVLLDGDGRLQQVFPAQPELLGKDMTEEYAHLREAVGGSVGVSEVVPSAVERVPVTAVAVPFDSAAGQRVLSGAFEPKGTPLGSFFRSVVPTYGGNAFLVDDSGHLIVDGQGEVAAAPEILRAAPGVHRLTVDGVDVTVSVVEVADAPWRTILVGETDGLYATVAHGQWAPWVLWATLAVVLFGTLWLAVRLNRARSEAHDAARTDALTGIPNRRSMLEVLERQVHQAVRAQTDLVLLLIDVDRFKAVNDQFGHHTGDEALRIVAAAIRSALRQGDLLGRWGGEEFLVVLAPTTVDGAADAAERVRAVVEGTSMPFLGDDGRCTVSIGSAVVTGGDLETALSEADRALYQAKAMGRNQVVASAALTPSPS